MITLFVFASTISASSSGLGETSMDSAIGSSFLKKPSCLNTRIEVEEEMVQEDREIVIRIPCLQEFSAVFLDTEEGREG